MADIVENVAGSARRNEALARPDRPFQRFVGFGQGRRTGATARFRKNH
jgi:hypothetical protein